MLYGNRYILYLAILIYLGIIEGTDSNFGYLYTVANL